MQSIEEINKSRIGVCWETVELSRHLLEQAGYKCTSYFAIYNDIGYFCHTCLVVEKENCFYWFEVSFNEKKGIKKYENLNKLYEDIKECIIITAKSKKINPEKIEIYEYTKPKSGISCLQFYINGLKGKRVF